jgi:hypothetical protein
MSVALLTAALLVQSMPAPGAAQWEDVGAPRGGTAFAVDPASIARTGDRVSFRMRTTRDEADEQGIKVAVIGYEMDCRARTAMMEAIDLYKTDGSFDHSIPSASFDDDPQPVSNDPVQQAIMTRVCQAPAAAGH